MSSVGGGWLEPWEVPIRWTCTSDRHLNHGERQEGKQEPSFASPRVGKRVKGKGKRKKEKGKGVGGRVSGSCKSKKTCAPQNQNRVIDLDCGEGAWLGLAWLGDQVTLRYLVSPQVNLFPSLLSAVLPH